MTDFLKVLLNIRSLRAVARDLTLEQLEEGLAKLTAIVEERRNDEAEDRKSREERDRKISEYMNMLRADGIDPAELFPVGVATAERARNALRVRPSINMLMKMANNALGPVKVVNRWPFATPSKLKARASKIS